MKWAHSSAWTERLASNQTDEGSNPFGPVRAVEKASKVGRNANYNRPNDRSIEEGTEIGDNDPPLRGYETSVTIPLNLR